MLADARSQARTTGGVADCTRPPQACRSAELMPKPRHTPSRVNTSMIFRADDAYASRSFAAVKWHDSDSLLGRRKLRHDSNPAICCHNVADPASATLSDHIGRH